jgi:hypothetical protein
MVFFLEITNTLQKSQDFWFAEFYLIIYLFHIQICTHIHEKEIFVKEKGRDVELKKI